MARKLLVVFLVVVGALHAQSRPLVAGTRGIVAQRTPTFSGYPGRVQRVLGGPRSTRAAVDQSVDPRLASPSAGAPVSSTRLSGGSTRRWIKRMVVPIVIGGGVYLAVRLADRGKSVGSTSAGGRGGGGFTPFLPPTFPPPTFTPGIPGFPGLPPRLPFPPDPPRLPPIPTPGPFPRPPFPGPFPRP